MDYYLDEEVLYKRSFDGTFLRCSNEEEARKALHEIHKGIGATHINRHMMTRDTRLDRSFFICTCDLKGC
jgi:hypothetical protein